MMSLQNTETIVTMLLLLGAYALSITLAEAGQAWFASRMGDDSAAREGWSSLNPFNHVDAIGAMLVVLLGFGWVRSMPLNHVQMKSSFQGIRVILAYLAQSLINVMLALAALTALVFLFGGPSLAFAFSMFLSHHAPLSSFSSMYPDKSSLEIVGALFLIAVATYNIFAASIGLITHGFRYAMMRLRSRSALPHADASGNGSFLSSISHDENALWITVFILLIFFAPLLRAFLFQTVAKGVIVLGNIAGRV